MGALGEDGLEGALALRPQVVAAIVVDHARLRRVEGQQAQGGVVERQQQTQECRLNSLDGALRSLYERLDVVW